MCGRFSTTRTEEEIRERFEIESFDIPATPNFNCAPGQNLPVVKEKHIVEHFRWGLVPNWAKDSAIGYKMINARAETVSEKPAYRHAFQKQRCLVIADGFFEWKKVAGKKVPFYITLGGLFSFAGIWDSWEQDGETIRSFSIITCAPNKLLSTVHDRMPVILEKDDEAKWLDEPKRELLKPYPAEKMSMYQISDRVNNVSNNSMDVLKKAEQQTLF